MSVNSLVILDLVESLLEIRIITIINLHILGILLLGDEIIQEEDETPCKWLEKSSNPTNQIMRIYWLVDRFVVI